MTRAGDTLYAESLEAPQRTSTLNCFQIVRAWLQERDRGPLPRAHVDDGTAAAAPAAAAGHGGAPPVWRCQVSQQVRPGGTAVGRGYTVTVLFTGCKSGRGGPAARLCKPLASRTHGASSGMRPWCQRVSSCLLNMKP